MTNVNKLVTHNSPYRHEAVDGSDGELICSESQPTHATRGFRPRYAVAVAAAGVMVLGAFGVKLVTSFTNMHDVGLHDPSSDLVGEYLKNFRYETFDWNSKYVNKDCPCDCELTFSCKSKWTGIWEMYGKDCIFEGAVHGGVIKGVTSSCPESITARMRKSHKENLPTNLVDCDENTVAHPTHARQLALSANYSDSNFGGGAVVV